MTSFEQTLLQEIAILPESRRPDVLAFIVDPGIWTLKVAEIKS